MKRIIFLISFLIFFGCVWGQSALCPSDDYNTFLMSVTDKGPADLVNENAYETKEQKFDLTYDLTNLTQDVIQARVELYRYLDEDAMNEGWKLERTLYFSPPFSSTIPLLFDDLKKGKTYSITLIVTTDMPNILLRDNSAPIDITTKTVYFLWPKEHGMHLSATTSYEGEPRRQHFKVKWSSTTGSSKTRIKAHHSNNTENPVLETPPEGEIAFPREEVWNWPIEDLSSVSVDALDGAGNVIGSTGIVIGPDLPLKDLRVLPCKPIPINPSEPELSSQYDKVLNDGNVEAVVSYKYGGAFFTLRFIPYCCNNNGKPFNLVNNLKDQPGAGGLLWQTAFVRKNDKWKQWDNLDPIRSEWSQETWEITDSYPDCIHGDKYKWNPTQGGQEDNTCEGQEVTNENKWDNKLYKHNGNKSWTASPPAYANPSLNDPTTETYLSPILYTSSFKFWYQLNDTTYSNHTWNFPDDYEGQPQGAMESTIHFIPSINNGSSGIEVSNSILIHCPCADPENPSSPCHCKETDTVLNKGGTNQLSYNFQSAIQDNVFFGSEKVTKTYFFDPTSTVNRYGMVKRTPCLQDANGSYDTSGLNCLCPNGENSCLEKRGWKKNVDIPESHDAISENWVPYALMSTPNDEAWILIYNDNDFSKNGETAEVRRIIQTGLQENVPEIVGCNTFPFTSIPALTDDLNTQTSEPDPVKLKSVIFVGPTLDSVMEHLQSYSCGQWPRLTTGFYISGTVSGAISSGVTMTLSGAASMTTTTASDGSYSFSGLSNGSYTITPSKSGYTFSPTSTSITINGTSQTGINFVASIPPADIALTSGVGVSGSVAQGSYVYYTIYVPGGATNLSVTLTGLSADIDLYDMAPSTAGGTASHPTTSSYTGRSYNGGTNNESLSHSSPTYGTWSIAAYGYAAGSYTVTATVTTGTTTYSISGTITLSGSGLSGVTVTAGSQSATTSSTGAYTISGLANGTYTVTPSKSGYTFSPANYSVTISGANVTGKDFTATVVPVYYTISGTITLNGSGFSGVTVTAGSQSATTSSTGAYTISGLANGNYTVTPSKSGYTFSPANYSVTINGADVTGKNFTATASTCSGYTITLVNNYCTSSINPSLSCYPAGSSVTVSAASDCQLNGGNICPNFNYWGISVNNGSETKNYSNELNYTIPSGTGTIQFKAYYTGSQCSSSRVAGKATDSSDNAIAGIKMKMGTIEQSTDDKGEFTFIDLPSGDYILEPSEEDKAKYDFDPPKRNIHIEGNGDQHKNQDFKVKLK